MLSRSLPEQVRRHLERITGGKVSSGDAALRPLRAPLKHKRVSEVLEVILNGLSRIHPRFGFRHFYDPALVNPETIAYWLIELAQQTRENFCGYVADIPPAEHYGRCQSHRSQLSALAETFILGISGDPCRSRPMEVYQGRMNALLVENARNRRAEIDLFVRKIGVRDESQRERIRHDIAENICGDAFFIFPTGNDGPN